MLMMMENIEIVRKYICLSILYILYKMEHLFGYFKEEIDNKNETEKNDIHHYDKIRFMYFFMILFIILFISSFFDVI